jgi:hypothetical protein
MPITRRNVGRNHTYRDSETGSKISGVTTIIGAGFPKSALMKWAGEATADYAIDHWEELGTLPISERWKRLRSGRYEYVDRAANQGRKVHKVAQRLLEDGGEVEIPEGLEGFVKACVGFLDDFDFQAELTEFTCYSETRKHAGTGDAIGTLLLPDLEELEWIPRDPDTGRVRALIDWKTSRSGIYGETALQLAGYRFSEHVITPEGEVEPMPGVDFAAAVHLKRDGTYAFVPLECEQEQYRDFLYVNEVARIVETSREWVGDPIPAPRPSRWTIAPVDPADVED